MERTDKCGLGSWRPGCMQRFASNKWFLIVYSMLGVVQGMSFVYMVATLTTLEKRFKIPSKTTGLLMSGNEVSQAILSLLISYYGGRGSRPLWISWGVALSAMSCYILALLHFLYGSGKDALALTEEYLDLSFFNSTSPDHLREMPLLCMSNKTREPAACGSGSVMSDTSLTPMVLIFLSQLVLGIGVILFYSLGQTYLDDYTKKINVPFIIGIVISLQMLGSAVGYPFSSFCLSLYVDPRLTPVITSHDPRWIGAWWLGWLVLGSIMLVLGFLMAWFPMQLPSKRTKMASVAQEMSDKNGGLLSPEAEPFTTDVSPEDDDEAASRRLSQLDEGFLESLKRLLQNKLLLCNIFAGMFYALAYSGKMVFFMKYVETQFHTSAAGASMISGTPLTIASVFGLLSSGFLIGKFKPRPKILLGWNVLLGLVHVISSILYIFISCEDKGLRGLDIATGKLSITNKCNSECGCEAVKFQPVCYLPDSTTFYSACQVGCHNATATGFTDCSCIPSRLSGGCDVSSMQCGVDPPDFLTNSSLEVENGPCPVDCNSVLFNFVLVGFSISALSSTGTIGNRLVSFRCVKKKDKALAQGMGLLAVSLLAFIPGPIIFGAIIDTTCLIWDSSCSDKGNCWLYNKDKYRLYTNAATAVLATLGVLLDMKAWQLGNTLDLYGESDEDTEHDRHLSLSERRRELSFSEQSKRLSVVGDDEDDRRSISATACNSNTILAPGIKVEAAMPNA